MASSMAMDKIMTKRIWLAEGLPTPRTAAARGQHERACAVVAELGLPLIVKPRARAPRSA
jgi:D-alanine-D-alanine ligase